MHDIFRWIAAHPVPTAWIAALAALSVIAVVAYIQGREISLWPPRIGGRKLKQSKTESDETGVFRAIQARKSVRTYLNQPVEPDKIDRIFEAARLAPSASNRQEWRFVLIDEAETLKKVARASCIQQFIANAPCVVAACADTNGHVMQCGQLSYPIDIAIALDHMSLTAVELGLGTCWLGMFNEATVKDILGIPEKIRVVALMTLGYPADSSAEEKKRLPIGTILKRNRW